MKFLHVSDLHIGKMLYGYDLAEDQKFCFGQICAAAREEKPDAVLIAGDVFDRSVPAGEAYTLLDDFLEKLTKAAPQASVFIIAGNHDSPKRLGYASGFLKSHHIYVSTMPPQNEHEHLMHVELQDEWGEVSVWLMPFVKPGYVPVGLWPEGERTQSTQDAFAFLLGREHIDTSKRNVIVSHQLFMHDGRGPERSESEQQSLQIGGLDQVETSLLSDFEYGALGHIHKPQSAGAGDEYHMYRYCGTPMPYSVGESNQQKSITVVTLEAKKSPIKVETRPLEPLHRVIKLEGALKELLEAGRGGCSDYVSISLTDRGELFEPRQQLDEVYERILELHVKGALSDMIEMSEEQELPGERSPVELFGEFYREIWGEEMSEREKKYLEEAMTDEASVD